MRFYRETEFQETEIGKIPKDWKTAKLGSLVKYVKGKKPSSLFDERLSEEYIPYLTAEYMRGLDKPKWCNPKLENNVVEVSRDDVVMIWDGSYAGHVFTGFNGILASTMVRITPIVELDKKFLYYYLLVNFEKIRSTTVGTGIPHVNKKVFEEFPIPIPPLAEQQKIAEILSSIDRAIEDVDKTIARLERLKKALMGELLAGRVRVKEVDGKLTFYREIDFQETEIGKIPKEWKVTKLGNIITIKNGKRPPLSKDGLIPVYGANGIMGYTKEFLVDNDYTIVIGRVGASGEVHLAQGKIWISDNALYSEKVNKTKVWLPFLYYLLKSKKLDRLASKTTHPIITQTILSKLTIQLPPLAEQQKIAEILLIVDRTIELYINERDKLEKVRNGLMNILLTGKVRVRED
jgi:type I restriction enzyme S subunit